MLSPDRGCGPGIAQILRVPVRYARTAFALYMAASIALAIWLLPTGREQPPHVFASPRRAPDWNPGSQPPAQSRRAALRQARVWRPIESRSVELAGNPPDSTGALSGSIVRCRYLSEAARGTTAKFGCVLPDGEVLKVKYGHSGEIHAEFAASRLLAALGFGADRMFIVPRVRCYGCVRSPFYTAWAFDYVRARELLARSIPEDAYTDFEWVAVERRHEGVPIEAGDLEGWAFFELDEIDPARGANRAERDALRLAAMLLAHWDNKAENQRLVCLDDSAPCTRPFAFIHDLGATFGPNKIDLAAWRAAPIWADRARCTVSMAAFPYSGGTFRDARISEAGRQLIVRQLAMLSEGQIAALFTAARFQEFHSDGDEGADVSAWVRTFAEKVRQIADAGPCE
jgi:hypothetical protein